MLLLVIVFLGLAHYEMPSDHLWDQMWEMVCLAVAFTGLAVRIITIGYLLKGTSGRSTTTIGAASLNTSGMYSIVRNPLYLGNALIWLGISMLLRQWWVTLLFLLIFWLYYERIIYAEEDFLWEKFGDEFMAWAAKTPAFLPRLKNWVPPDRPFSVRKVLRRDYSAFFAIISAFTVMEILCDSRAMGKPEMDHLWLGLFIGGAAIYVTLRTLKKKTGVLDSPLELDHENQIPEEASEPPLENARPVTNEAAVSLGTCMQRKESL